MVGVPGRSKACANCRRRRIKCDLGQPACERCLKANLVCGGIRGLVVIQHEARQPVSDTPSTPQSSGALVLSTEGTTESPVQTAPPPLHFGITLRPDDIFLSFARSRLFQGPDSEDINVRQPNAERDLSDASALALATTFFGAEHGHSSVVQHGLHRYSRALEQVNKALSDAQQCKSFDVLEAVVTMSLFEFLLSEKDLGWARHAVGFERLMSLRGPAAFMSLPELMIMERTRASIIFASHAYRKPTILAQPEWKSIPWMLYPERKTPMQQLLDIYADCPGLLFPEVPGKMTAREILNMEPSTAEADRKCRESIDAAQGLLLKLDQLEAAWRAANEDAMWEVSQIQTPFAFDMDGGQAPLWSSGLHYRSLGDADMVLLGSGIRILLLNFCRDLPYPWASHTKDGMHKQTVTAAITICRSIEYELQEISKGASNHLLYWPVKVASEVLGPGRPTLMNWLNGILTNMEDGLSDKMGAMLHVMQAQPSS